LRDNTPGAASAKAAPEWLKSLYSRARHGRVAEDEGREFIMKTRRQPNFSVDRIAAGGTGSRPPALAARRPRSPLRWVTDAERWRTDALILVLVASAWATETRALNLVVPNANALVKGDNANGYPFALAYYDTQYYQQVYDASQFGALGTNGGTITAIGFRGYPTWPRMVYSLSLNLSTTARAVDGLDATLASNLGPDNQRVFSGRYTLDAVSGSLPQPLPFRVVVPLQSGFFYNPTNGNLLLDLTISDSSGTEYAVPFVDEVDPYGDSVSRAHRDIFDTHTWLDSIGAITQFGVIPVVAPKPRITSLVLSGTNWVATGSGGAGGLVYSVLSSTNLSAPITNWVPTATNAFESAGNFHFTNSVDSTLPRQFLRLQVQ
jgi:hypothetical protein